MSLTCPKDVGSRQGNLSHPRIVDFSIRKARNPVNAEDPPRRLVGSEGLLDERHYVLQYRRGMVLELNHCDNNLSKIFVRNPHHCRIADYWMLLQNLLNLLREYLTLPTGDAA